MLFVAIWCTCSELSYLLSKLVSECVTNICRQDGLIPDNMGCKTSDFLVSSTRVQLRALKSNLLVILAFLFILNDCLSSQKLQRKCAIAMF